MEYALVTLGFILGTGLTLSVLGVVHLVSSWNETKRKVDYLRERVYWLEQEKREKERKDAQR